METTSNNNDNVNDVDVDMENIDLDQHSTFTRPSSAQIENGIARFAEEHEKKLSNCQRFQKLALEKIANGVAADLDKIISDTLGITTSFVEQQMVFLIFFMEF